MPDLAQIFGAGSSDPSRGLLFYEKIGLPIEKTAFSSFSQSCGVTRINTRIKKGPKNKLEMGHRIKNGPKNKLKWAKE